MPKRKFDGWNAELGWRLKEYRKARNLTLKQAAERCGVSHQQILKYERGANAPSLSTVSSLAELYGVNPAYICGWE